MILEVKVPSPGESITEVEISNWLVSDGDFVEKDQEICEIDSDKATLTISAEDSGEIKLLKEIELTIPVGEVICTINTNVKSNTSRPSSLKKESKSVSTELEVIPSPAAQKMIREQDLITSDIKGTGKKGRITKQDIIKAKPAMGQSDGNRQVVRNRLSTLRKKLAKRLSLIHI